MPTIPESVYRLVEKKIRGRNTDVAKAQQALYRAQQRAFSSSAPATDQQPGRGSATDSRTEKAVLGILRAEERLEKARAWEEQLRLTDKTFPPDTLEGRAAELIFVRGFDRKSAARIMQCTRETLNKRLDAYVCHAALYAAAAGLIDIKSEEKL